MIFLFLLTNALLGLPGPAPTAPGVNASAVFTADAPAGNETALEAVQQRRNRFVGLVKRGLFERFDDAKQEAIFKRNDPSHSVHEPGPLEDEAIASTARETLAAAYAKLGLKPRITCASGKLSITILPDDPATAASVIDAVLGLDGVQIITAALPPSLRMP